MLKVQRAAGLLLVALGGAYEASAFAHGLPSFSGGLPEPLIAARLAAIFGAVLYSLTMTGRKTDALTALLPVPALAPAAAVLLAWRRGDLSRAAPAPRRLVGWGEGFGLALALAALGSAAVHAPAFLEPRPVEARPVAAPAWPAPVAPPASPAAISYEIQFKFGTTDMEVHSSGVLARVADTMHYYPLDDLMLSANAPSDDPEAVALAGGRLELVRQALLDHGISRRRIRTQVTDGPWPVGSVDILILPN